METEFNAKNMRKFAESESIVLSEEFKDTICNNIIDKARFRRFKYRFSVQIGADESIKQWLEPLGFKVEIEDESDFIQISW